MSEIAIKEKMNGTEQDRMGLNGNSIGFENTVDYCLWMVNEIHQYLFQQTWMVFAVQDRSTVLSCLYHLLERYLEWRKMSVNLINISQT